MIYHPELLSIFQKQVLLLNISQAHQAPHIIQTPNLHITSVDIVKKLGQDSLINIQQVQSLKRRVLKSLKKRESCN